MLEPKGIRTEQLYVKAKHRDRELYYPARLTAGMSSGGVSRYVFKFRSGGGFELDETIAYEEQAGRLSEVVKRPREQETGGVVEFDWTGRGATGVPEPTGVYHLKLEGKVFGKTDRALRIDIPFYHDLSAAP